jgi:hypothetical protein
MAQKPLYDTGSFSGFHTLNIHLLHKESQPFCGDPEGWGPLSKVRYDFTPCFVDVWVAAVAGFGVLGGAVAVLWLVRGKGVFEVGRNWHFWVKMVCAVPQSLCRRRQDGMEKIQNIS